VDPPLRVREDWWVSKDPSLMRKSGANESNESSLSNCRVQPALSKKEGRVDFRKNLRLKGGQVGFRKKANNFFVIT